MDRASVLVRVGFARPFVVGVVLFPKLCPPRKQIAAHAGRGAGVWRRGVVPCRGSAVEIPRDEQFRPALIFTTIPIPSDIGIPCRRVYRDCSLIQRTNVKSGLKAIQARGLAFHRTVAFKDTTYATNVNVSILIFPP